MAATIDSIFEEALHLSEDSRMNLVERLIVSASTYQQVEEEQVQEARCRLYEMRSGAIKGVPVEDAFRRVRESLITIQE
ncbi:addiction module protein [Prosthecobacter sp. SYSU 5D2]